MSQGQAGEIDFAALMLAMSDTATIIDSTGHVIWANTQVTARFGWTMDKLVGSSVLDFVHPDDVELAIEALTDSLVKPGAQTFVELRLGRADGRWVPMEIAGTTVLDAHASGPLILIVGRPMGWRATAREVAGLIGGGASVGRVLDCLARLATELLEVPAARVHWADQVGREGDFSGAATEWPVELFDQPETVILVVGFAEADRPWTSDQRAITLFRGLAAVLRQREADLASLRHRATHDELTGFDNRRAIHERLHEALFAGPVGVLFVDLDGFKLVNDSFGHHEGDAMLRAAAARLKASVAGRGTVGRYGGDEFVVVLPGPPDLAEQCATDVVASFRNPLETADNVLTLTVSVGVAHGAPQHNRSDGDLVVASLIRDAGIALHQAKQEGRDRWIPYTGDLHLSVVEHLEAIQSIRRDLGSDALDLFFQPQVELRTGRVVGWEALLRWLGPDGLTRTPAKLLEAAAQVGMLTQISRHTLIGGCRQLQLWRQSIPSAARWFVGVNLSPAEVDSAELLDLVVEALDLAHLQPTDLQLEIVEHAFAPGGRTLRNLTALHDMGVSLAIDDFGTGESSLARLRDLPVDVIKIDRSLITGVLHDPVSHAIASSIAVLGERLGVKVVAEGVETSADRDGALEIGCHFGQGHFLGSPAPPDVAVSAISGI